MHSKIEKTVEESNKNLPRVGYSSKIYFFILMIMNLKKYFMNEDNLFNDCMINIHLQSIKRLYN